MEIFNVTILPENITVSVEKGTSLLIAAEKAGVSIESQCGGNGTCGKCAVKVISGGNGDWDNSHLPGKLKEMGYVAACQIRVEEDITVEVPFFSRLTGHHVLLTDRHKEFVENSIYFKGTAIDPVCKKLGIKLETPAISDSMNDFDRLKAALYRNYGIGNPSIGLSCLRKLPQALREGGWEITVTVVDTKAGPQIVDIRPGISSKPAYGLAVDIGTTTIAVNLLELDNGTVIDSVGTYNKQGVYGSDVISRIIYTDENPEGAESLQKAVISTINELTAGILRKHHLESSDISVMVCAGNTVMSHLFMKIPATYLRLEPYIPGTTKFPVVRAEELGIGINPLAPVIMLPSVASYVGGDITAGVLATMITKSEKLTLFIDIGTNGELVLGNSEWLVTCSCSAGPAFEGSGISCGMRAMDGAIDRITIDRESLEAGYRTVGNTKPVGICGSGLIYSLSEMMDAGIIDRAGGILVSKSCRRIRKGSEGNEYVLVFADESGSGQDIVVTEADIKNLLRAKGAIFAGIRTMLKQVQLDINDVDRVYIAGGFGNYINIPDAVKIGLLPDLPLEKFEYVGNSCIQGAMIALLCRKALDEAEDLADMMTYLELSTGNMFMDEFVSALFIPHTDLNLFPSAGKTIQIKE